MNLIVLVTEVDSHSDGTTDITFQVKGTGTLGGPKTQGPFTITGFPTANVGGVLPGATFTMSFA